MLKAYKYRIYPSNNQKKLLSKHFGMTRWIYNTGLEIKLSAYNSIQKYINYYSLSKQLTDLKTEFPFVKEINSQSLQMSLRNLDNAFDNFFKKRSKFPNFKSKKGKQSFQIPQFTTIENNLLYIPKFKEGIKIILHRKFKGNIKTVTISKVSNKYFASILVDNQMELPSKKKIDSNTTIGIDLGIKDLVVTSDNLKIENPHFLIKSKNHLQFLQRRLATKKKGSNKYNKFKNRITKLHEKIRNQRNDFLHKLSNEITNQYDTICMEDLDIKELTKRMEPIYDLYLKRYLPNGQKDKSQFNKYILDCGWGNLVTYIKYKSEWKGKNFIQINQFDPSSKLHSKCGYYNHNLKLTEREWLCPKCNEMVDRDHNAAINIKNFGLKQELGMEHTITDVELTTLVEAMKHQKRVNNLNEAIAF